MKLLRQCRDRRPEVSLVSAVPLTALNLTTEYSMSQWMGKPRHRDLRLFLRALQNRAPFASVLPDGDGHVEYQLDGDRADGIGTAHLLDALAVSLPLEKRWDSEWVRPMRAALEETDEGDLQLRTEEVAVRHASTAEHLTAHEEWVAATGLTGVRTAGELWKSRADFFPHLSFLARVEDDLRTLRHHWLTPVRDLLLELEVAVSRWDVGKDPEPAWRTKITPESETRKRLCRFVDLDGTTRVFDLHARMTPGAGRLHFRIRREDGTAVIAYIGPKLKG
ncbi:hypothetical protein ACQP10_24920 [Streptosporangium sandarakinum]|uniref:hypothetical protein n=1 Tax=Streptosporangium sandarakinum TaxID=1260955 RepID=UPI003D8D0BEF